MTLIEIKDHEEYEQRRAHLLEAVERGVGDAVFPLRESVELVVASSTWGSYGAILVLRLDEDEAEVLLYDSYLVGGAGAWQAPNVSSGSAVPMSWWGAIPHGLPEWQGTETAFLGSQFRVIDGVTVASISLRLSQVVSAVRIHHGSDVLALPVLSSGFVTAPVPVLSRDDVFEVEAMDSDGTLIERLGFEFVVDGLML